MVRDTKLRMSIDPKIIETMATLQKKMEEKVEKIPNNYNLQSIPFRDGKYDIVFTLHSWEWSIRRVIHNENWRWGQDEECWTVQTDDPQIKITTYGKMCVDINREIFEFIDKVAPIIDSYSEAVLCSECGWNGDPDNIDGMLDFIDKHIVGKTGCRFETTAVRELRRLVEDD